MFQEQSYKSLRSRLLIDTAMMDEELIHHPFLLQQAAETVADAMQIRDSLKSAMEITIAEAAARLRVPGEDGKLPSEAKLNSLVIMNSKVKAAQAELEEANHDLRYWQALADSFKEKGGSLKRIAELTIAGYLAPNTVRRRELAETRDPSLFRRRGKAAAEAS